MLQLCRQDAYTHIDRDRDIDTDRDRELDRDKIYLEMMLENPVTKLGAQLPDLTGCTGKLTVHSICIANYAIFSHRMT